MRGSPADLGPEVRSDPLKGLLNRVQHSMVLGMVAWLGLVCPLAGYGAAPFYPVPAWAQEAVWYQIFVDRFRNGDPANDPTPADMRGTYPRREFDGWKPTPWTQDWYQQEAWAKQSGEPFFTTVQARRYGGDLQGLLDELDYLDQLGVNALYLNPINDAPSLHKYDARHYRHVDRNFGPDPAADRAAMRREDPDDLATWEWTAADRLFLKLIAAVHRRGMRLIVDYSWNHVGTQFWAFQDLVKNQSASPYADWFQVESFDDPATPENEFRYHGWLGIRDLPEWRKIGRPPGPRSGPIEGTLHPGVRRLIHAVIRRWMDPNGDGDPTDGVDGFRLDVAAMIPLGFWREFRTWVRDLNPEAFLVAELWWEKWPVKLMDPRPWFREGCFDSIMHYQWFVPTRSFLGDAIPRETAASYVRELQGLWEGIPVPVGRALMNVAASHDTPRLATSLFNPGLYKYQAGPRANPRYKINKPNGRTRANQRLVLIQQFTYQGAPHIYYGDEVGMWGADDPDCRKPMVWSDQSYQPEKAHPLNQVRPVDPVAVNRDLLDFYQRLIRMRRRHKELFVYGDVEFRLADDARNVLAYERVRGDQRACVVFNKSTRTQDIRLANETGVYLDALRPGRRVQTHGDWLEINLPPNTARVLIRQDRGD